MHTDEVEIDDDAATRVWESALGVGGWERAPVRFHGDTLPGALIVRDDACAR
jgi:aminoglycoside phosphotransferase (APT) family kinase protein